MCTHTALAALIKRTVGKKRYAVPLFLPTVFGEEKGSVDIKEGRVPSHVEHQRKTAKSGDKLLLVYSKVVHCQLTLPCKMWTIMQMMGKWEKHRKVAHN